MVTMPDFIRESAMLERITRLESDVAHIRKDLDQLKQDVRDLRTELKAEINELRDGLKALCDKVNNTIVWALVLFFSQTGTLLYVMARGFKWL